uniref:Uncharacterized protein n=1 Tax=Salix viminalis TaxID=40686 RepID=A0A6N2KC83_SALVM
MTAYKVRLESIIDRTMMMELKAEGVLGYCFAASYATCCSKSIESHDNDARNTGKLAGSSY